MVHPTNGITIFESLFFRKFPSGSVFLRSKYPESMKKSGTHSLTAESKMFPIHQFQGQSVELIENGR